MKQCTTCHQFQPLSEFYPDKRGRFGRGSKCKTCFREYSHKRYATQEYRKHYNEWSRKYQEKNREHENAKSLESYYRNREVILLRNRTRYADKRKARKAVEVMIRTGKWVAPTICERCHENGKTEAHHRDYSKRLEVEWLCGKCHGEVHSRFPS